MAREPRGSVVVVVGATSGIGRAAAVALADRGARLALAARDAAALDAVAVACRRSSPAVLAVPTDVRSADDVDRLAATAVEAFGRIDTWVNTAAGLLAGELDQVPLDDLDGLVATNVRGTLLTSRAALAQFRRQGDGVLINVSSILSIVPNPVVPAYTMSKYAIRGLSLALHHNPGLRPRIRCCEVLPGPVDSPIFARAANHTGHLLRSVPPAAALERAAAAIVSCARRPRRQVVVGWTGRLVVLGQRVWPSFTEGAVARYSGRLVTQSTPAEPTSGALLDTGRDRRSVHGGWRRGRLRRAAGQALGRWRARTV